MSHRLHPVNKAILGHAGVDLAAVVSAPPVSLKKIRMEARRDRWRENCTECGSHMGAKDAFFHSRMWDDPDDEFLCKGCVADKEGAELYSCDDIYHEDYGMDFYPEDYDYCCLHDAWEEYEGRQKKQEEF